MARVLKSEFKHHAVRIRADNGDGEILLVGHGKRAYVWCGRKGVIGSVTTYSGEVALRKLARAILDAVGDA